MVTSAQLLDLDVSHRQSSFRFDLYDVAGNNIGTVTPFSDLSQVVIENNINRSIKRSLTGLVLGPSDVANINTLTMRIAPVMVLSNGDEWPLGLFVFADDSRPVSTAYEPLHGEMVDLGIALDQTLEATVAYNTGALVTACLAEQFELAGIHDYLIDPSTRTIGSPVVWVAGRETRGSVMSQLAGLAGMYSPFFTNAGAGRIKAVPDLDTAPATLTYEAGGRIFVDTILTSNDTLRAPNRWLAIDTSATETPISGVYDIPDSAPHSIANRGFAIVRVVEGQGFTSEEQAVDLARSAAAQSQQDYSWISFAGAPDPRHDTFDIVQVLGEKYREQRWAMTLVEGSPMQHECRRVYEAAA